MDAVMAPLSALVDELPRPGKAATIAAGAAASAAVVTGLAIWYRRRSRVFRAMDAAPGKEMLDAVFDAPGAKPASAEGDAFTDWKSAVGCEGPKRDPLPGRDGEVFHAIVVGAGPSGSATAFYLAKMGIRVLLLDKARFPRDKYCGDAVCTPAIEILKEVRPYRRSTPPHEINFLFRSCSNSEARHKRTSLLVQNAHHTIVLC